MRVVLVLVSAADWFREEANRIYREIKAQMFMEVGEMIRTVDGSEAWYSRAMELLKARNLEDFSLSSKVASLLYDCMDTEEIYQRPLTRFIRKYGRLPTAKEDEVARKIGVAGMFR